MCIYLLCLLCSVYFGKFAQRLQLKSACSFCPTEVKERSMSFTVEELLLFQSYVRMGGRGAFMWTSIHCDHPWYSLSQSTWSLEGGHVYLSGPAGVGGVCQCCLRSILPTYTMRPFHLGALPSPWDPGRENEYLGITSSVVSHSSLP